MIPTTVKLLTYTPLDALLIIANESLNTSFTPGNVDVASIAVIDGRLTECTIVGKATVVENCANRYEQQAVFVYNRIDLSTIFGVSFSQAGDLPTTVNNILGNITKSTGILFDEHDFEDRVLNTLPITLVPKSESRRWVGNLNIVLTA
jgi:hypothetical protein